MANSHVVSLSYLPINKIPLQFFFFCVWPRYDKHWSVRSFSTNPSYHLTIFPSHLLPFFSLSTPFLLPFFSLSSPFVIPSLSLILSFSLTWSMHLERHISNVSPTGIVMPQGIMNQNACSGSDIVISTKTIVLLRIHVKCQEIIWQYALCISDTEWRRPLCKYLDIMNKVYVILPNKFIVHTINLLQFTYVYNYEYWWSRRTEWYALPYCLHEIKVVPVLSSGRKKYIQSINYI